MRPLDYTQSAPLYASAFLNGKKGCPMKMLNLMCAGCLAVIVLSLGVTAAQEPKDKPKDKPPPDPLRELIAKHKDLIPSLMAALKDSDPQVRITSGHTLVYLGKEAVPALIEALQSKDRETRANAAFVLGGIGKPAQEALPALIKAMRDNDDEVRQRVIYAINRIVAEYHPEFAAPPAPAPTGGYSRTLLPVPPAPGLLSDGRSLGPAGIGVPGLLFPPDVRRLSG